MPINFIPNDPKAGAPVARTQAPVANRPSSKVRFVVTGLPPQAVYPAATANFVAWQSREAAFRTLDVYEQICGALPGWTGRPTRKTLRLVPNAGVDLNAYYDRDSITFFQAAVGGGFVFSGASSDVVAHEAGHAILDAIRPDLWDVSMIEVAAFHEGFGDCIAIMFALSDQATRTSVLASLGSANFVEATAEELSNAIKAAAGPSHNAAAPRRARNNFKWALPQTLPANGPPGTLINESHSLGQLVSGVYYDLIRGLLGSGAPTQLKLWNACQKATLLLAEAARQAPIEPRFLASWGRTMLAVDQHRHGGANIQTIKTAFANHGLTVSATGFLAPQMALTEPRKRKGRAPKHFTISATAKERVRDFLRVEEGTVLRMRELTLGRVTEIAADAKVDLSGLSERLAGVVTHVPRPVMVGESDGAMAVVGAVAPAMLYSLEVREFVATLVGRDAVDFGDGADPWPANEGTAAAGAGFVGWKGAKTHVVNREAGEPTLKRVAFSCGCTHRHPGG